MLGELVTWAIDHVYWITAAVVCFGGSIMGLIKSRNDQIRKDALAGETRPTYDMTGLEVTQACRAACLAYRPKDAVVPGDWERITKSKAPDYGLKLLRTFSSSGREVALFANEEGTRFLAIRGTDGLYDAFVDLVGGIIPSPAPLEGYAHGGFQRMANRIRDEFREEIESDSRLILCGHSMGAAVSILLGNLCHAMGHPVTGIVALCAPRSSTRTHAASVEQAIGDRLIRVTVSRDIVSLLPPFLLRWRHVGNTAYFDRRGRFHYDVTHTFRWFDLFMGSLRSLRHLRLFRDMIGFHSGEGAANLVVTNINRFRLKN